MYGRGGGGREGRRGKGKRGEGCHIIISCTILTENLWQLEQTLWHMASCFKISGSLNRLALNCPQIQTLQNSLWPSVYIGRIYEIFWDWP